MKKVIVFFAMAIVATVFSAEAKDPKEPVAEQYIITDCGTVHSIPADSSEDYACFALQAWSNIDCE